MEVQSDAAVARREHGRGVLAALLVFSLWGFLPLLFHLVAPVDPLTIVADRSVSALIVLGAILLFGGRWSELRAALADRRALRVMLLSSALLIGNWLLYVWAVNSGHVLESSFGYFINPLVNVAIGMVLLGERQNRVQSAAILLSGVAIAVQAVALGSFPFIAIGLALTFGFYGYIRKTVSVSSATGLFIETLIGLPFMLTYLAYTVLRDGGIGPHGDPFLLAVLILAGPATALPLLLFAYAIRRLRMSTLGMFQYIAPSVQFLLAVTYFGEHLDAVRLVSFALIWISLLVFTAGSRRTARRVEVS